MDMVRNRLEAFNCRIPRGRKNAMVTESSVFGQKKAPSTEEAKA